MIALSVISKITYCGAVLGDNHYPLLPYYQKVKVKLAPAEGNRLDGSGDYRLAPGAKAIVKLSVPGAGDE